MAKLNKLVVTAQPTKVIYNEGDKTLDLKGLVVTGTWEDGGSDIVPVLSAMISGFDTTSVGTKTIWIKHPEGPTTGFDIEVKELPIKWVLEEVNEIQGNGLQNRPIANFPETPEELVNEDDYPEYFKGTLPTRDQKKVQKVVAKFSDEIDEDGNLYIKARVTFSGKFGSDVYNNTRRYGFIYKAKVASDTSVKRYTGKM